MAPVDSLLCRTIRNDRNTRRRPEMPGPARVVVKLWKRHHHRAATMRAISRSSERLSTDPNRAAGGPGGAAALSGSGPDGGTPSPTYPAPPAGRAMPLRPATALPEVMERRLRPARTPRRVAAVAPPAPPRWCRRSRPHRDFVGCRLQLLSADRRQRQKALVHRGEGLRPIRDRPTRRRGRAALGFPQRSPFWPRRAERRAPGLRSTASW